MKLEDGLYVLPSASGASAAVAVADGTPLAESFMPEEGFGAAALRFEIRFPENDFSSPVELEEGAGPGRAAFAKSLVKTLVSLSKASARESLDGLFSAWAAARASFEPTFVATCFIHPNFYVAGGKGRLAPGPDPRPGGRISDLIETVPGWHDWLAVNQAVLASGSEDAALQKSWLRDPFSVPGWEWTKEDAEECGAVMASNPAYAGCF